MSLQTPLTNTIYGTILANGTLSSAFNVQGYSIMGLQALSTSVNGTIGFMVSDKTDVVAEIVPPGAPAGTYRTLYGSTGTPIAITAPAGQFAITSEALLPLAGYQFVRISSTAQTNGLSIVLTLKAN